TCRVRSSPRFVVRVVQRPVHLCYAPTGTEKANFLFLLLKGLFQPMSGVLLVPIHLDALLLKADQTMVEATADFTRVPYSDGTRDMNPDIAYISEAIVSRPFENENLFLKAGIHLHWALPDALTRGFAGTNGMQFPAVPNRWLVTRSSVAQGK